MTKVFLLTIDHSIQDNYVIVCDSMKTARRLAVEEVTKNPDPWVNPGDAGELIQLVAEINTTRCNVVYSRRFGHKWINLEEMEIIT